MKFSLESSNLNLSAKSANQTVHFLKTRVFQTRTEIETKLMLQSDSSVDHLAGVWRSTEALGESEQTTVHSDRL